MAFDLDDAQQQAPPESFPPESPDQNEFQKFNEPTELEPTTMKDHTIPEQPAVPIQDKNLRPQVDPYINQPMFVPPDPRKQQLRLFDFPGTLSRVYPHLARIDDIPIIAARDDSARIIAMLNAGGTPVVQAVEEITGEYSGGKIPVPGAEPLSYHDDGTPLYHYRDLGWDPVQQIQVWPRRHGPAETGRMGTIPIGARMEVWNHNATTGWFQVAYSTGFDKLQHHLIRAWVEPTEIRLIGDQRMTPFIKRH